MTTSLHEKTSTRRLPRDFPRYVPDPAFAGSTVSVLQDPIGHHLRAHRQFGPIYLTSFWGRESLCLGGAEVNDFVWRNSGLWDYSITKASFREEFGDEYLTQLDGLKHKKKRMRLNPSFRPDFLMRSAGKMGATCLEDLEAEVDQPIDLRAFAYRLLLRMTTKGLLGLEIPKETEDAILLVENDLLLGGLLGPARGLWFSRPRYRRAKMAVVEFLGELIDRWTIEPERTPEMFKSAMNVPEGEPPLGRDELIGDLYILMTGGLNSTANLMMWLLMQVGDRPAWLAELRAEVEAVPPAQFTAMKQWPKIKSTILEVERLRPATPQRTLIPATDFEYEGIAFRKGEPLTHFIVLPHFLPENYEEPEEFRPERFLGETAGSPKGHATFGGGPHMCIGMPLARLQSPLILANTLLNYEVEFLSKLSFKAKLGAALTPVEDVIPVRLTRRTSL
jgi:cytochrome P450